MCGIFGYIDNRPRTGERLEASFIQKQLNVLFRLSETRGKEAAGLALLNEKQIGIHKDSTSASHMMKTDEYRAYWKRFFDAANKDSPIAAIGHTRLVTNGMQVVDSNNQPVVYGRTVVVHNGIIVNDAEIWKQHPDLERYSQVDTEVFAAVLDNKITDSDDIEQAIAYVFEQIYGETSVAVMFSDRNIMALATNTGSLYTCISPNRDRFFFVSEDYIARQARDGVSGLEGFEKGEIRQVRPGTALIIDLENLSTTWIEVVSEKSTCDPSSKTHIVSSHIAPKLGLTRKIEEKYQRISDIRASIKRCRRCILPETVPYIEYDGQGVCNFCNDYEPLKLKGRSALVEQLDKFRKDTGEPDCLVAFSGGRDSSFGLHLLKREFGMNPIAYTYDWGMVTDLARRNQARMCDKLGIEHLWVSADIKQKRKNVRNNVHAWMKKPDLGMIPLFMAGDKQFFYYANKSMKQTGIDLMIFCQNELEVTGFKSGFAGVPPKKYDDTVWGISKFDRLKMINFYLTQFLTNPSYLNRSLFDTAFSYFSYYYMKKQYIYPFSHIEWNEDQINDTLINEYGWELAPDTSSTWRIGDGTAPFYNYIYLTVAGFTEFDTFRSNQIRENMITREQALKYIEVENLPRWESIHEYLELIQVDFVDAMQAVDKMPKLYL